MFINNKMITIVIYKGVLLGENHIVIKVRHQLYNIVNMEGKNLFLNILNKISIVHTIYKLMIGNFKAI